MAIPYSVFLTFCYSENRQNIYSLFDLREVVLLCVMYIYTRISTSEERDLQKFTRQESALQRYAKENNIEYLLEFREQCHLDNARRNGYLYLEWTMTG